MIFINLSKNNKNFNLEDTKLKEVKFYRNEVNIINSKSL
jgi:hypothetical protein